MNPRPRRITAWMLAHPSRSKAAQSGAAAAARPGRWNTARCKAVYAYPSLAMPIAEAVLLAGSPEAIVGFRACRVQFSEALVSTPSSFLLPSDPSLDSSLAETRETGRFWLGEKIAPVMEVPSASFPGERIYVIDPDHPKFRLVKFSEWFVPAALKRPRQSVARALPPPPKQLCDPAYAGAPSQESMP